MHVLDVGSGTGDDVRAIAELVGPGGTVTGLEPSRSLLDAARARGVPANVRFEHGTAQRLPFADETFDAVRAERVLQHLRDPQLAVVEMKRVLRPGGTALTFDQDWKTVMLSGADPDVTETILASALSRVTQPRAGSRAQTLMRAAGLCAVHTLAVVGRATLPVAFATFIDSAVDAAIADRAIDEAAAKAWLFDLLLADRRGEFFFGVTVITAIGTRGGLDDLIDTVR
jgi:SAM-dependent methyltransferase